MKDYKVTIKVRNNRILTAIEEAGGEPGLKWCVANGLSYCAVNDLIKMTASPLTQDGNLSKSASSLCEVLGKLPEELWSNEQLYPLEKNFSELDMDYAQIMELLPQDQQTYALDTSDLDRAEAQSLVGQSLNELPPRLAKILQLRFGLSGAEEHTLEKTADVFNLTRTRIMQLEKQALRLLRHPTRACNFAEIAEISDSSREFYRGYKQKAMQ